MERTKKEGSAELLDPTRTSRTKNQEGLVIIPTAIGLFLITLFILGFLYLTKRQSTPPLIPSNQENTSLSATTPTPNQNIFQGDDFSIVIPEGWQKSPSNLPGTTLTLYKTYEDHSNDPNAEKINFKSYIAISFDKTQGRTQNQLLNMIKQSLTQVSPNTKIITSTQENIDNFPANFVEFNINQQDVDFHILVALIIKKDKYFSISANTTEKKWPEYKEIIYETIRSFKFREKVPSPT